MTIFDRSVRANGIALYLASSYQQSHHLHIEYMFLYATKKKTGKRKIGIIGKKIMRKDRYIHVVTISLQEQLIIT